MIHDEKYAAGEKNEKSFMWWYGKAPEFIGEEKKVQNMYIK